MSHIFFSLCRTPLVDLAHCLLVEVFSTSPLGHLCFLGLVFIREEEALTVEWRGGGSSHLKQFISVESVELLEENSEK